MELLPGGTLKDRVKERGPFHQQRLSTRSAGDCRARGHARVGVLHRDVKPANCFVDSDGTVKVGDFGLSISTMARDVSQLTMTGAFLGTPQFAPPEQLKGYPLDVRPDIYAVGATLYYLLTGRPPFEDTNLLAIVARIATEAPPSPRTVMPRVPRGLADVVLSCLAKDAADRPADYAALNDALRPFSSATPAPATLGLRLIAGAIDSAFLGALTALITISRIGQVSRSRRRGSGSFLRPMGILCLFDGGWNRLLRDPGRSVGRLVRKTPDRSSRGYRRRRPAARCRTRIMAGADFLPSHDPGVAASSSTRGSR